MALGRVDISVRGRRNPKCRGICGAQTPFPTLWIPAFAGMTGWKANNNAIIAYLRPSRLCVKFLVSTRPSLNRTIIAPSLSILPCHSPFPCAIALNSVRRRDMLARETCQMRERLQAAPGGNRPRRTDPSEKRRALLCRRQTPPNRSPKSALRQARSGGRCHSAAGGTSRGRTTRRSARQAAARQSARRSGGNKSEEGTLNGLGMTRRAWRGRDGL